MGGFARELSREFGGRPDLLWGVWFPGCLACFGPRPLFFILVGNTDMGMPFGASEQLDVNTMDRYIRR